MLPSKKISVVYCFVSNSNQAISTSLWPLRGFRLLTAIKIFEEENNGALRALQAKTVLFHPKALSFTTKSAEICCEMVKPVDLSRRSWDTLPVVAAVPLQLHHLHPHSPFTAHEAIEKKTYCGRKRFVPVI